MNPLFYSKVKRSKDPGLKLVSGQAGDRLAGLDALGAAARGKTVLDIACHNGTVATEFARAGAGSVDGVDFWKPGLDLARTALAGLAVASRFEPCDLTGGIEALRSALDPLPTRYDIVLYLGIHHHLARQMAPAALEILLAEICNLASAYIAIRTPEPHFVSVDEIVQNRGFSLWYEDATNSKVGMLRVYRRVAG